jgi:hypothetical protein
MVELDIMDDAEEEDEDAAIVEFDEVDDDEVLIRRLVRIEECIRCFCCGHEQHERRYERAGCRWSRCPRRIHGWVHGPLEECQKIGGQGDLIPRFCLYTRQSSQAPLGYLVSA